MGAGPGRSEAEELKAEIIITKLEDIIGYWFILKKFTQSTLRGQRIHTDSDFQLCVPCVVCVQIQTDPLPIIAG